MSKFDADPKRKSFSQLTLYQSRAQDEGQNVQPDHFQTKDPQHLVLGPTVEECQQGHKEK